MTGQLSLFDYQSHKSNTPGLYEQQIEPISINKDTPGAGLVDLLPDNAQLALTRNYGIRAELMSLMLKVLSEKRDGITREELNRELGIPKKRLEGLFSVARKGELIYNLNELTPFGVLVLKKDPYIQNAGLLALLHYILASNAGLVIWSHLFNQVFQEEENVEPVDAQRIFSSLKGRWSEKSLRVNARKELGGILRTYADEMFKPLELVSRQEFGTYSPNSNSLVISETVWLSSILVYRDRYYPGASALEISLIVRANYSPGRILRQNEAAVRRALDELHNADLLTVETRSGLDQVRFKREITWLSAIAARLQGNEEV